MSGNKGYFRERGYSEQDHIRDLTNFKRYIPENKDYNKVLKPPELLTISCTDQLLIDHC